MKKVFFLILLSLSISGKSQFYKSIFSKDPIINLENFQKQRFLFGFHLGFNYFDFKIDYKTVGPDVLTKKTPGLNVGLALDLRLHEYFRLRFEPGLFYTKRLLVFPNQTKKIDAEREVNSTYIHLPLLLKFSALRTGNIRPYLIGGGSFAMNLSSNSKSKDDNQNKIFRVKQWTSNYELGVGIDIFSEYFIFSPSIRGVFGIGDELIRDNDPNSPWTSNIQSIKNRGILINLTFH